MISIQFQYDINNNKHENSNSCTDLECSFFTKIYELGIKVLIIGLRKNSIKIKKNKPRVIY